MRNVILSISLIAVSSLLPACTCIARDAETYRQDTRSLVETRNSALKECYDAALVTDPNISGEVVVNFTVEKKTGKIINTAVNEGSTAPSSLGDCIVDAIDGMTLDPFDQRDGEATFTWRFQANPPAA